MTVCRRQCATSRPTPPRISTRSSSAPAFPASTSSTGCVSSASGYGCSRAGTGVGGTWYWNRYPGARFDSESYTYGYSFSPELLEEWDWEERFASQPETERYLNYVADKFDLRRDIQCSSRVTAAHYQEEARSWDVILEDGRRLRHALPDHCRSACSRRRPCRAYQASTPSRASRATPITGPRNRSVSRASASR